MPPAGRPRSRTDAKLLPAARALALDAFAAETARALTTADVPFVLLKGPTVARWLYRPDEVRGYLDVDILVSPEALERARKVLAAQHLQRSHLEDALPHGRRPHAEAWVNPRSGLSVDLHSTLPGVGVDPGPAWRLLIEDRDSIEVGGQLLPQLGEPARALLVALHAAHHGIKDEQTVADLSRALSRVDVSTWKDACALAGRLGALPAFATGLRLVAPGRELADRLELPATQSVESILRASSAPELALSLDWLLRAPGVRARAILVTRKFAPPPRVLRTRSRLARRGVAGLALAYALQPLRVAARAAPAIRAWLDARAQSRKAQAAAASQSSRRPPRP